MAPSKRLNTTTSSKKTTTKKSTTTATTSTTKSSTVKKKRTTKKDKQQLNASEDDINDSGEDEAVINSESEEDEEFDYFSFKSDVNKTSNQNLSNTNLIEGSEIAQILDRLPEKHVKLKHDLKQQYIDSGKFREMYCDLKLSYNLLLYGYGSKKDFIQTFLKEFCTDGPSIQIYGYLPSFNIKDLLFCISHELFGSNERFTSPMLHCGHIKSLFDAKNQQILQQQQEQEQEQQHQHQLKEEKDPNNFNSYPCLYIVIHNIDGVAFRNIKVQRILAYLSEIQNIHFICSIDHFNSYMLWDINLQVQFNFIPYSIPTFQRHIVETAYEVPLMNKGSKIQWKSIVTILKSLPPNARNVFQELVEYLIQNQEHEKEKKMAFNLLFEKCVESFLVSSEAMLKTLLVEFNDHGVIQTKIDHGETYLTIPVVHSSLKQILEELKEMNEKKSIL